MHGIEKYIEIRPQDFVVLLVSRLRNDIESVSTRPAIWWFIIQDLDLALNSQLVAFLSGPMQIGALKKNAQKARFAYLNDNSANKQWPKNKHGEPISEELAPLKELLERACDPKCAPSLVGVTPLTITEAEKADIHRIHDFRNELAHIKPASWSLEIIGLPRMALATVKAIKHMFESSPANIHLVPLDIENCKRDLDCSITALKAMAA